MSKKLASVLFAAMVLLAWTATDLVAQTASSSKPNVVTKSTGHPEKQTTAGGSSHHQTEACGESGEGW